MINRDVYYDDDLFDTGDVIGLEVVARSLPQVVTRGSTIVIDGIPQFKAPQKISCPRCDGELILGTTTLKFKHAPAKQREQRVEAWVCQCGESYVPGETARDAYHRAFSELDSEAAFANVDESLGRGRLAPVLRSADPPRVIKAAAPPTSKTESNGDSRQATVTREQCADKTIVLFLAADPTDKARLALGHEHREIEDRILASDHRDSLALIPRWAVRPRDILQVLNQFRPHIVHFSGHGSKAAEIILLDSHDQSKPVTKAAISKLFGTLKDNIRLVVLNACYSHFQAEEIVKHVDCAVGMSQTIGDDAAIHFAAAFYQAIGFGRSVQEAFDQAVCALMLEGIPEETTPRLLTRQGVEASQVVLVPGPVQSPTTVSEDVENIRKQILAGSKSLLNWPRTLRDGQTIDRPELGAILNRIASETSSTTLLLGAKGSGKSALLATAGVRSSERGMFVVGIKADAVPPGVRSIQQLGQELFNLTGDLRDAIRQFASVGKVVVMIDQLDAVSELVDRRSDRLNVLLNLIQSLSDTPGVHVIASCREFDHLHDARLTAIEANLIELELPTWEQLSSVLPARLDPNVIGDDTRELLRTPLHMKLFLELELPEAQFGSLHSLLEELWNQNVIRADDSAGRVMLLERLARRMSDEEDLWLAGSIADDLPAARDALISAEILATGASGTIGFRHQTYYDYALARTFARGTISLADHVLGCGRQDGLFVRPVLLSGLYYLRDVSKGEYHRQLQRLIEANPRQHIRTLLIEFLGEQSDPDHVEAEFVLPLLKSDDDGPKVLTVVAGSPGWFAKLKNHDLMAMWMTRDPEQATMCRWLLVNAVKFDPNGVIRLLRTYWLGDARYDALSFSVFSEFQEWDVERVDIVSQLARRTELRRAIWLAKDIAENAPALAPRFVRVVLDRQREEAVCKDGKPDGETTRNIIENRASYRVLKEIAERAPKEFCREIWPWLIETVTPFAREQSMLKNYLSNSVAHYPARPDVRPDPLIDAILSATCKFAELDPKEFSDFMNEIVGAELAIVHQILSEALVGIADRIPKLVFAYLTGDERRLMTGGGGSESQLTEKLITKVYPHLTEGERVQLELLLMNYSPNCEEDMEDRSDEERMRFDRWGRVDRLRLLRAIPDHLISSEAKTLRDSEEIGLVDLLDATPSIWGGRIGPRMTPDEVAVASAEDVIVLLDELAQRDANDGFRFDTRFDASRAGDIREQARALGNCAENHPDHILRIVEKLSPDRHEECVEPIVSGLAKSTVSTEQLVKTIEELDDRGFKSDGFREGVASALTDRASKETPLNDSILERLEGWLPSTSEPTCEQSEQTCNSRNRDDSILFSSGGTVVLKHGRGSLLRALLVGYGRRDHVNFDALFRVFEQRLATENHPEIWAEMLYYFAHLFSHDKQRATRLYDAATRKCPEVLQHYFGVYALGLLAGHTDPQNLFLNWLEMLAIRQTAFCNQAFGELAFLYYARTHNASAKSLITQSLAPDCDSAMFHGLLYAASHFWYDTECRAVATEVLSAAAETADETAHQIIANALWPHRDEAFELDHHARRLIQRILQNPDAVLRTGGYICHQLVPFAGIEPAFVSDVCKRIVDIAGDHLTGYLEPLVDAPDALTSISITLHRQQRFREDGLNLFEKLLSHNVRETRIALDRIDRRPSYNFPSARSHN